MTWVPLTKAERKALNKAAREGGGGHYNGPRGLWYTDKTGVDLYGRRALKALEDAANLVEAEHWDSGRNAVMYALTLAENNIRDMFQIEGS
jgi:hypothetical protein